MKAIFFLCTILVLSLLFVECNKCHNIIYYVSQDQLDFSNFKVGSYWIMKDSLTGRRDSFVVNFIIKDLHDQMPSDDCSDKYQLQTIYMKEFEIATNTEVDSFSWGMNFYANGYNTFVYDEVYKSIILYVPFNIHGENSNVFINGNYYNGVSISSDTNYHDVKVKVYINSSDVLLKLSLTTPNDTKIWELEKANIIR